MLGLRRELADRHVFDHAPAQRAHRLVGHGGAPVLSEVGATPRSQDRTLPLATPIDNCPYRAAGGLPRERFSPMALPGPPRLRAGTSAFGGEADQVCSDRDSLFMTQTVRKLFSSPKRLPGTGAIH